ncbi:MAG: hypothetical protein GY732_23370 [Gammaproteobacteria bacterium]|nr:hypothetical protein [Gammaproteobacteria bacterium]
MLPSLLPRLFVVLLLTNSAVSGNDLPNPILFVTQVPIPADFATIGSTFANHNPRIGGTGRGGDLYIRYPNGVLRNLTAEAGFGNSAGHQGPTSIAVRDPYVHSGGTKALFSMVIGAPPSQYIHTTEYWQIYEVSGLGEEDPVVIRKIPQQPGNYNNISPVYASDGRIIFTSDRPRGGDQPHLYPQHDEYESTATNTGLWSLDPGTGGLFLLQHSPSGSFTPIIDSFGRIIFTRWDHLQRDQQADADELAILDGDLMPYETFTWSDENASAAMNDDRTEVFPEPRGERVDLLDGTNLEGHTINHFSPWQLAQDGTGEETVNHIGRHDLHGYFNRSFNDDPNLAEFNDSTSGRLNTDSVLNMFQIKENPQLPGTYVGIEAPEFATHASGQIISLKAPPSTVANAVPLTYLTHPDTATVVNDGETSPATHSGHYRDPLPLSDGALLAAHTTQTHAAGNTGTRANPIPRYDFQIKHLVEDVSGYLVPGTSITGGIVKAITYWDPDVLVSYSGPMWEMQPVEVRARTLPPNTTMVDIQPPELQMFSQEGVDPQTFLTNLASKNLALAVSRNVTSRDVDDRQQPFNLAVPDGVSTVDPVAGGKVYDVSFLQFFQGDQIRGIGGIADPNPGRRVLAREMHDEAVDNPSSDGPLGSVSIAADGSIAAIVPARRAMSWQLLAPDYTPVVRERVWITFQPGEIRVCASCHGLSSVDQADQPLPQNPPQALADLLRHWKETNAPGSDPTCSDSTNPVTIQDRDFTGGATKCESGVSIQALTTRILNSSEVTFSAPVILLNSGFEVESGSSFEVVVP